MTQQTATVCKALQFFATLDVALVRSVMLVHVLAANLLKGGDYEIEREHLPPFALSVKCKTSAILMPANHSAFVVSWGILGTFVWVVLQWRPGIIAIL